MGRLRKVNGLMCVSLDGPLDQATISIKQLARKHNNTGPVPTAQDTGGAKPAVEPDKPVVETSTTPPSDTEQEPASAASIKSRAEIMQINCRS